MFEADNRIGGHSNTVKVSSQDEASEYAIDTGFVVHNERTYPNFTKILDDLQVESQPTEMSFSVRCDRTGLEYNGSSINGLFAQRRNLGRLSFWRMLNDILRFNREGSLDYQSVPTEQTVGDYLSERNYSREFAEHYLLPMGAAIWSCPCGDFARFPIRFILQFYHNHGLLSLNDRPEWRVIAGGSKQYVEQLSKPFVNRIRLNCPVQSVRRLEDKVRIVHPTGEELFDEVVFACHSDQALSLLSNPSEREREILSAFPYSANTAVLHSDESLLPRSKRAWACWNYHINSDPQALPTVTYNMSMLQNIKSKDTYCVTLNESETIDPSKVIARFNYSHPIFTAQRESYQRLHDKMIRHSRISYCGAYWRNGFHEDGVVSALNVCRRFGISDWTMEIGSRVHSKIRSKAISNVATDESSEVVSLA